MPENYIPRSLEPVVERAFRQFLVVVLIGPRQSGKTTLLRNQHGTQLEMAGEIARFRRDFGDRAAHGYVVHPSKMTLPLGGGTTAVPFAEL